jgi:hypothetical protein
MSKITSAIPFVAFCTALSACGSSDSGPPTSNSQSALQCPVVVSDADCDKSKRPFVFVHGTYGFGANFAHVASLMTSNGYCPERIVGVEYNSLGDQPGAACTPGTNGQPPQGCGKIDDVINKVLADNPDFTQVDLAGHSQGTAHCKTYLGDPANAAKVAHYFNFSGVGAVPNDVPTLSVSSEHDLGGHTNHATPTPGSNNVVEKTFTDQDHFACAASTDTFKAVYNYLYSSDHDPDHQAWKYDTIQCGDEMVTLEGIAETFADNTPVKGKLEIREVSTARAAGAPIMTLNGDSTGHIGPIQLKRGVEYEFKGFGADGSLIGYVYFTPWKRSDHLVRLLSPANADDGSGIGAAVASQSTDFIKRGADHVAVTALWLGGAFRQDLGASMLVDGKEVLVDDNAGATALQTAALMGGPVGFYMFDDNDNKKTDLGLVKSAAFQSFTDVYMQTDTPALIDFSLTPGSEDPSIKNEKLTISNWPSSDALILEVFQ